MADGLDREAKVEGVKPSAARRRRSPAVGPEAVRREQWGKEWGKAGRDAGNAARKED